MPKLTWRHAAVCVLGLVLSSAGVSWDARALPNSTSDDADRFPFVVAVEYNGRLICSGTVLYPRIVVTAAHCLQQLRLWRGKRIYMNAYLPPEDLSVRVVQNGVAKTYAVAEVAIAPEWLASSSYQQSGDGLPYDLSLLITEEPIDVRLPLAGLEAEAPLVPGSPAGAGGHRGVLVGFGGVRCPAPNECPDAGVRRYVHVAMKEGTACFKSRIDREKGLPGKVWCTDSLVLPGDSGGALMIEAPDGTLQFAGVISAQRGLPPEFRSLASWQQSAAAPLGLNRDFVLKRARALGYAPVTPDP